MDAVNIPSEISVGGIYFPPILFAIVLGVSLAMLLAKCLDRLNLTRFIWHPPLFLLALSVVCTWIVGMFVIPI